MKTDGRVLITQQQFATADKEPVRPSDAKPSACDTDGHCVTCADEALPARVLHVDQATGLAVVDLNGTTAEVDVTLVDEVRTGQVLLIHGGVAIASLEEP